MMTGKFAILPPAPVHCCMPWHARWVEECHSGNEVYGAMCCFCDRSIAAPDWTAGKHVACIYCGLDRGLIPAIDVPIGESADEHAAVKSGRLTMPEDIVQRLRGLYISVCDDNGFDDDGYTPEECEDAANEIESLRQQLAAEREECATLAEKIGLGEVGKYAQYRRNVAAKIASAIRARSAAPA